jgi:hypothetical protein
MNLWARIKACIWCPGEEYIEAAICDLMRKAEEHPGKMFTRHFGWGKSASVIIPKEHK